MLTCIFLGSIPSPPTTWVEGRNGQGSARIAPVIGVDLGWVASG